MLGLCTEKQINTAIGAPEDDVRAHNLLSQMGFSQEIAERDAEKNRQNIEELQREVFGNDRTTYYVRISDVSKKLCLIHYSRNAMKALGAVLRETRDEALKDETSYQAEMITDEYERTDEDMSPRTKNKTRKSKKTQPAVRAARTIKKPFFRIDAEAKRQIEEMAANCPIRPNHDFRAVRNDTEYLKSLTGYFPNASVNMMMTYLFRDEKSVQLVQKALRDAGVSKAKGQHAKDDSIMERAAFVCWTGSFWKEYLKQICEVQDDTLFDAVPAAEETSTPSAAPEVTEAAEPAPAPAEEEIPAAEEAPTEDEPSAAEDVAAVVEENPVREEPAAPAPVSSAESVSEAEIVVRGPALAVLDLLATIEKMPDIKLVESYYKG